MSKYETINTSPNTQSIERMDVFTDICNELQLKNKNIPIEGNVRQGMIGDTDVVVIEGQGKELIIESIRTKAKDRGKGSASQAMERIIGAAQKRDLTLRMKILPQDSNNKGLNISELKSFYERKGFVFNDKLEGVRVPSYLAN